MAQKKWEGLTERGESVEVLRQLIDADSADLSVRRQCELLGLSRSTLHYEAAAETETNLCLMRLIDEQYLATPFYGSRRMAAWLSHAGHAVNRKRVQRLMRLMGLEALYPKPRLSEPNQEHRKFPYLLRGLAVNRVNQVWATDITYVPLSRGFMYLVAVIDWHSRYVLSWRLSNSLEGSFCMEALEAALEFGCRRSSTRIRECSSRVARSRGDWKRPGCRSAWMGGAGRWTTCSSNGCGGA